MLNHYRHRVVSMSAILIAIAVTPPRAHSQTFEWIRQFGSTDEERIGQGATDSLGNVYVSALTYGNLISPFGYTDPLITKYDSAGNLLWKRQLQSSGEEQGIGLATDAVGNAFVVGYTSDSFGEPKPGGFDAFLTKLDSAGNTLWTRLLGTANYELASGVATDPQGNVFVSGATNGNLAGSHLGGAWDAFLAKYDSAGNQLWKRQFGTSSDDFGNAVSADPFGNVYASGQTSGDLAGPNHGSSDTYVAKFDAAGNQLWSRQFGSDGVEYSGGTSSDELGNIYLSGFTSGSLAGTNAGGTFDAFVTKYDAAGDLQWNRQLGTAADDRGSDVSADEHGNVFLAGATGGNLGGTNLGGYFDAFIAAYRSDGNLQWTKQLGAAADDQGTSVVPDGLGSVYLAGGIGGSFSSNTGKQDGFVAKFRVVVPEPSAASIMLGGLAPAAINRRRRRLSKMRS